MVCLSFKEGQSGAKLAIGVPDLKSAAGEYLNGPIMYAHVEQEPGKGQVSHQNKDN